MFYLKSIFKFLYSKYISVKLIKPFYYLISVRFPRRSLEIAVPHFEENRKKPTGCFQMETYDLIILGAGSAGLAGAMYGARLGLKILVLGYSNGSEMHIGGTITTTNIVKNYPGFKEIGGLMLAKQLEEHAREYKSVTIKQEKIIEVKKQGKEFLVKTEKKEYSSKTILFATGTSWKKLDVPGAKKFERKGIDYCALCSAPLFKDKVVVVVGGANAAACEALILAIHAKKVYMIYRGKETKIDSARLEEIKENKKIEIIYNTNIKEIKGNSVVKSIVLDKPYNKSSELKVDGVFVAIGHEVLSGLAKPLGVKLNEKEEIIIDHKYCTTNVSGVFAAGDVANNQLKQVIIAVAQGCTASHSAYEYIEKNLKTF